MAGSMVRQIASLLFRIAIRAFPAETQEWGRAMLAESIVYTSSFSIPLVFHFARASWSIVNSICRRALT